MIITLCDRCGCEIKDKETSKSFGDCLFYYPYFRGPGFRAELCISCYDKAAEFASPRLYEILLKEREAHRAKEEERDKERQKEVRKWL